MSAADGDLRGNPVQRIEPGAGRVLCFAPHPDDEILGAGGTLRRHVLAGAEVGVVLATDGVHGDPEGRFAGQDLAALRRAESRAAQDLLGIGPMRCWGLPDSYEVTDSDRRLVTGLAVEALQQAAPDTVYLPWAADRHPDHLVLHRCVMAALETVDFGGEAWGYEVWAPISAPDAVVDIGAVLAEKRAALDCFATQLAYNDIRHMVLGMNAYRSLILEQAAGYGEAFQRLR